MSRNARRISESNTYHIMLRGNERKDIFKDSEDKLTFIDILHDKKKENAFRLYAYCIMSNHAHLVIREEKESISNNLKSMAVSYAYYFNKKYKRVGHVFQDRFRSECIDDEAYLLNVIRYVHNNPEKAEICKASEYQWSSLGIYLNIARHSPEAKEILNIFSNSEENAIKLFCEFGKQSNTDYFIDMEKDKRFEISEANVSDYLESYLRKNNIKKGDLKLRENKDKQIMIVKKIAESSSLSSRRIADVTGINREAVRTILLPKEPIS